MYRFGLVPFHRDRSMMDAFDSFGRAFLGDWPAGNVLRTDIKDNGDSLSLQAELPGVAKENVEIEVNGDVLTITVRQDTEKEEKADNYLRRERVSGSFCRSFDVTGVDTAKITASYQDGILSLEMPKKRDEGGNSRKIDVA